MMLSHPGAFRSVGIVSGPTLDSGGMTELANSWLYRTFARVDRIFGPPDDEARKRRADPFVRWRSPEDLAGTRLFVAHGDDDRDGIERTNRALHLHLEERGIAHRYVVYRGGHRWNDWKPVMAQAIRYGLGAD